MKVGFVSIVGRPNVGKSTLLNTILSYKVSITSSTPQTTRDQIKGIYTDDEAQIIFIDTPGIHKPQQKLSNVLNSSSFKSLQDIELVLFLQPADQLLGPGDKFILDKIKNQKNKVAIITKIDVISDPKLITEKIEKFESYDFDKIITTSVKNLKSIETLVEEIKTFLPEGEMFYEEDEITDKPIRFIAKELIREAAIEQVKQELPHSIGIEILEFKEKETKIDIIANLVVERKSQKGIVIGAAGRMIKKIGQNSRHRISETLEKKINLELHVKVDKNWTDDDIKIKKMGY